MLAELGAMKDPSPAKEAATTCPEMTGAASGAGESRG
jgi:hypothetical protein